VTDNGRTKMQMPTAQEMIGAMLDRHMAVTAKASELREVEDPSDLLQALTLILESQSLLLLHTAAGLAAHNRPRKSNLIVPARAGAMVS
jgi:hypothetical protein